MTNLKTLKVCLSRDLPSLQDRDSNTIYFLRDKLIIYLGKSMYHDPYAIVENIPEEPISDILYFLLSDGTVQTYMEYQMVTIAQIEDEEQLELLRQTGSIFFVNSQRRYLDLARRIVTLPYNNGTYELTVDMADSLKINEKTVIGFNPSTNMFEMVGDTYKEPIFDYKVKNTDSVNTIISDKRISSEVKISEAYGNIIRVASDGLYANVKNTVSKNQFDSWSSYYQEYKAHIESYLRILDDKIEKIDINVSNTTINERIISALQKEYSNIDQALDKFDEYIQELREIEIRVKEYSDKKYEEIHQLLSEQIRLATEDPWGEFFVELESDISQSIPGELDPNYNTGVEDQGTTYALGDGDDTTPIENNTSEYLPEDNESIQGEEDQIESNISSEQTELGDSMLGGEEESNEPVDDPNTSTEPENSGENPTNP